MPMNLKEYPMRCLFVPTREGVSLQGFRGRAGNLVVLSPHPDDDVLGAGGAMIEAAQRGRGVFSVTVTDGRGSPRRDPAVSDEEMAGRRQGEAEAALKIAGAAGGFFLKKRSSELEGAGGMEARGELMEIFRYLCPAEVFLPDPYERHRTHQRCTRLCIEALRSLDGPAPLLLGYSLWGSFRGGKGRVTRDISAVAAKKAEAVLAHSSQVAYKDYARGILAKNHAEAVFLESHEVQKAAHVETFLDMTGLLAHKGGSLEDFVRADLEEFIRAYL